MQPRRSRIAGTRLSAPLLLMSLMLAAVAWHQTATEGLAQSAEPSTEPDVLPRIEYEAEPFGAVIEHLQEISGEGITVRWAALRSANVNKRTPVTLTHPAPTVDQILRLALASLPDDFDSLAHRRIDGVHVISTEADLDRFARNVQIRRLRQPVQHEVSESQSLSLSEALAAWEAASGETVRVDRIGLKEAGIDPEAAFDLERQSGPADGLLTAILDQAGGNRSDLVHELDGSTVRITIPDRRTTVLRTYDIRDLVSALEPAPEGEAPHAHSNDAERSDIFLPPSEERIQQIMDLLRSAVDPDTWRAAGGRLSSMAELNRTLIVQTTRVNHEQIRTILGRLRNARNHMIVLRVVAVTAPMDADLDVLTEQLAETDNPLAALREDESHRIIARGRAVTRPEQPVRFSRMTGSDSAPDSQAAFVFTGTPGTGGDHTVIQLAYRLVLRQHIADRHQARLTHEGRLSLSAGRPTLVTVGDANRANEQTVLMLIAEMHRPRP